MRASPEGGSTGLIKASRKEARKKKKSGQQRAAKPDPPPSAGKHPGQSYTLEPIHNTVYEHDELEKGSTRALWVIYHGAWGSGRI